MAYTTTYDLCKAILKAIKSDTALSTFCNTNFAKQPLYFFEIDPENPPSRDDMPLIALYMDDVEHTQPGVDVRGIGIGCAISDDDTATEETTIGLYKGFETIEKLEALVFAAIEKFADESVTTPAEISIMEPGKTAIKCYYPYFHSFRQIKVSTER
jgi:hypothetical protein